MQFERREEFLINHTLSKQIQLLLHACFPDYPSNRTYFKQVPHFRFLVWEQQQLIGQVSVEYRNIRVGASIFSIFLLGDICVQPTFQHQKIASKLIKCVENLGKKHHIDFLLATASNLDLYTKNDFFLVDNVCRWVILQRHTTIGIRERPIENSIVIKQLGETEWTKGVLDFSGYIV